MAIRARNPVRSWCGSPVDEEERAESALVIATASGDEHRARVAVGTLGQLDKRRGNYRAAFRIARDGCWQPRSNSSCGSGASSSRNTPMWSAASTKHSAAPRARKPARRFP
jgi:hypothetical protein